MVVATLAAVAWLLVQSTVLPLLGWSMLPLDPILPLVTAFALGKATLDAWLLAIVLGYIADFFAGTGSGRLLIQYVLIVGLATPMRGRIVLRDRWAPAIGTAVLALSSGLLVVLLLSGLGLEAIADVQHLPREALCTGLAAALFWPFYRQLAGWSSDPPTRFRRLG